MAGNDNQGENTLLPHLEALLAQNCPAVRRKQPGPHNPDGSRAILIATNPTFGGGWEPAILSPGVEAAKQWRDAGLEYPLPIPEQAARSVVDGILQQKPKDPIGTALRTLGKARNRINELEIERETLKAALPILAMREISYIDSLAKRLGQAETPDDRNGLARAALRRVALAMAAAFASAESDVPRTEPVRSGGLWIEVDQLQRIASDETDEQLAIAGRLRNELDRHSGSSRALDSAALQSLSAALTVVVDALSR